MKREISRQIFEKSSNVKFYENPSSGSGVVPMLMHGEKDGRTDKRMHGQTNMTKLIVAFRNLRTLLKI
jgi:hypothetical protein